jgi:Holliday junction resolvasome RuvABC endonuclease subunit
VKGDTLKRILAIDPGTLTGWARNYGPEDKLSWGTWNNKTKAKTKKRPAELKHLRLVKLWTSLRMVSCVGACVEPELVILEDAAGFTRGKAATMAMHEFRAVVKLWCVIRDIELHLIQPADVKRFALNKGTATKEEMIEAACRKYGYDGSDDNEADALHMLGWAMENL